MFTTIKSADGAQIQIAHRGGQVISWKPANQTEQLFLSQASPLDSGNPVRGGVPVIFPQFSDLGPLPKHGFARNLVWQLRHAQTGQAVLELRDNDTTRTVWPHAFLAELIVTVSGSALEIELVVHNTGQASFEFTAALHTYLRVNRIEDVRIIGLQGTRYREGANDSIESALELFISRHIDRIYMNSAPELQLRQGRQEMLVQSTGFADTVIWNPWRELSDSLSDMEPDGYLRMVCVEAAAVGQPVQLAAGAVWRGSQRLTARSA